MTLPDTVHKIRNTFVLVAVAALALSYGMAAVSHFWLAPLDYWYNWMAMAFGFGGFVSVVASVVSHMIYVDTLRSN